MTWYTQLFLPFLTDEVTQTPVVSYMINVLNTHAFE